MSRARRARRSRLPLRRRLRPDRGRSLSADAGDRLVLVGPNGGGKSTRADPLGLLTPSAGQVRRRSRFRCGYVPQFPTSIATFRCASPTWCSRGARRPPLDAPFEPPTGGPPTRCWSGSILVDLRHAYLSELSGGELKRALVARALLPRPELLVLDEPSASLDEPSRRALWGALRELRRHAVVLAMHDVAPETFVPSARPGRPRA
ncbi:MAG: ATP-binding cassette domain-containing protein [Thermoanaerobaculia bacterium]